MSYEREKEDIIRLGRGVNWCIPAYLRDSWFSYNVYRFDMTRTDVTTERVIKDGELVLRLTWWKDNVFDHVEYVTDRELIY